MGFRGLGFRVLGFGVEGFKGLGFRGFGAQGFGIWGLGLRAWVKGFGFRAEASLFPVQRLIGLRVHYYHRGLNNSRFCVGGFLFYSYSIMYTKTLF